MSIKYRIITVTRSMSEFVPCVMLSIQVFVYLNVYLWALKPVMRK